LRFDYASRYLVTAPAKARRKMAEPPARVFGYGQIDEPGIEPAVKRLAKILRQK